MLNNINFALHVFEFEFAALQVCQLNQSTALLLKFNMLLNTYMAVFNYFKINIFLIFCKLIMMWAYLEHTLA